MADNNLGSGIDGVRGALGSLLEPAMVFAATGSKVAAIFAGMRGTLLGSVLGPMTLISGAMVGLLGVLKQVVKQSELLAKGMRKVREIETLETQFSPLVGGAERAQARIEELYHFAASTPFQLTEIAEASRTLEVLTKGALSTGKSLRAVGDAAAVSGQGMQTVAFWTGRLYDGLKSGRPIGEATNRLQEMGILSGVVRNKIDTLSKSGADFNKIWEVFQEGLESSKGGMKNLSKTLGGLESTLADVRGLFAAKFAENFLEGEKESVRVFTGFLVNMTPVIEKLGAILGTVSNIFVKFTTSLAKIGGNGKNLAGVLKALIDIFVVLAIALPILHFAKLAKAIKAMGVASAVAGVKTKSSAMAAVFSRTAHLGLTKQLKMTTVWFLRQSAGAKLAAGSGLILGGVAKGLAVAFGVLAGAIKAAFASLLTGPALIVIALASVVVGLFKMNKAAQDAKKAVNDANKAFREFKGVVDDSAASMQTLADKTALLTKIRGQIQATTKRIGELESAEVTEGFLADAGGKITGTDTAELDAQRSILSRLNREYQKIAEIKNANLQATEKQIEALRRELEVTRAIRDVELSRVGQMGSAGSIYEIEQRLQINNDKLRIADREHEGQKALEDYRTSDTKTRRDAEIARLKAQQQSLRERAEQIGGEGGDIDQIGFDSPFGMVDLWRIPFFSDTGAQQEAEFHKELERIADRRDRNKRKIRDLEKEEEAADPRGRLTQEQLQLVAQEDFVAKVTAFDGVGAVPEGGFIGAIERELAENEDLTQRQSQNLQAMKKTLEEVVTQTADLNAENANLTAELRVQNAEYQRAVGLLAAQNKHHRTAMQIFKETEGGRQKALESEIELAKEKLRLEKEFGKTRQNLEELVEQRDKEDDPEKKQALQDTIDRIRENPAKLQQFQNELDKANHSLMQFRLELAESVTRLNHEISNIVDDMEFDRAIRLGDGADAADVASRQAQRNRAEEERRLRQDLIKQGFQGMDLEAAVQNKMRAKDEAAREKWVAKAQQVEEDRNRAQLGMQERVFASDSARRKLESMDNQKFVKENYAKNLKLVTAAGLSGEDARRAASDMTMRALDAKVMQQIPAMKTTADEFRKIGRGGGATSTDPMKILAQKRLQAQKDGNAILGNIENLLGNQGAMVVKAG